MSDWQGKVYAPSTDDHYFDSDEWHELRDACIRRDKFICQRCDKYKRGHLSAHHIKPRAEGGLDDLINLMTLCDVCHDYVDGHNLTSRADIIGSMPAPSTSEDKPEPIETDWRKWVYGGCKRPRR